MSSEVLTERPTAIAVNEGIEQIEAHMLNMEQVDCPVAHHFGPGIYIREVTLPGGIFAIGHAQKKDHLNIMITGKVAVVEGDQVKLLEAPLIFTGTPGRKVGYVLETCVWQNVYATDETDVEKLEAEFLDKSDTWKKQAEEIDKLESLMREHDRHDFYQMLEEYGFSEELVRQQSENLEDQVEMPEEWRSFTSVRDSSIEGKGLFLSWPVEEGSVLAPSRINGFRTPAGRYTNHSGNPNCVFKANELGDIFLVSSRAIKGCSGGDHGEELTVDYRQALTLSGIEREICQV